MMPISGVNVGAGQPVTGAEKVLGASKAEKPEEAQVRPLKPVMDEYVPKEPQEPSGRYWMGKGEDGQPKIYFDDPERGLDAPKKPGDAAKPSDPDTPEAEKPEKNGGAKVPERKGGKEERCECDTGKVDREVEQLKKKQQELEQRLNSETDETRIKDLERQLVQVERDLKQKDNDTYRRQHATFTQL